LDGMSLPLYRPDISTSILIFIIISSVNSLEPSKVVEGKKVDSFQEF